MKWVFQCVWCVYGLYTVFTQCLHGVYDNTWCCLQKRPVSVYRLITRGTLEASATAPHHRLPYIALPACRMGGLAPVTVPS